MPYEVQEYVVKPTYLRAAVAEVPVAVGMDDDLEADW